MLPGRKTMQQISQIDRYVTKRLTHRWGKTMFDDRVVVPKRCSERLRFRPTRDQQDEQLSSHRLVDEHPVGHKEEGKTHLHLFKCW